MTDDDRRTDGETDRDDGERGPSLLERVRQLAGTLDDLEPGDRRAGSGRVDGRGVSVDHEYELSIGLGDRFDRRSGAGDGDCSDPNSDTYSVGLVEYDDQSLLVADLPDVDGDDVAVRRGDGLEVIVDGDVIERVDHDGRPSRRQFKNGMLTVVLSDEGECRD